jgi:hypothetical protein
LYKGIFSLIATVELFIYSHLSNNHGGWNKCGGGAKVAKSINMEVGKTCRVGCFGKN